MAGTEQPFFVTMCDASLPQTAQNPSNYTPVHTEDCVILTASFRINARALFLYRLAQEEPRSGELLL